MKLTDLGLTRDLENEVNEAAEKGFGAGRITQEHRERYIVSDGENEYEAEITGNLRFTASSRSDFPAVGDWVIMNVYDSGQALIHRVLPRKTTLSRQAVGKPGEIQIISSNIDTAFIVQAANNNFSINRLERYLTICHSAGIEPVLVLSKTDLLTPGELSELLGDVEKRDRDVKVILLSNVTLDGLGEIMAYIQKGRTYCVVGSSGVGKSTLINNLLGKNILRTGHISESTNKGRHITEHRELFVLENGGIIIDTPGMKELGTSDSSEGLKATFSDIESLSSECRYPDCRHINESGCAVIAAVREGKLDPASYENYLKIMKEQERFRISVAEKHKRDKVFGKILKNYFRDSEKYNDRG